MKAWWCERDLCVSFVRDIDEAKDRADLYYLISRQEPVYTPAQQKKAREAYKRAREAGKSHRQALEAARAVLLGKVKKER